MDSLHCTGRVQLEYSSRFRRFYVQALRNKAFGSGCEFVWSASGAASGTYYATREASGRITIYKDFVEETSFKPPFPVDEIFGGNVEVPGSIPADVVFTIGYLLCVKTSDFICFYEWSSSRLIRRIDVVPTAVIWSDSGDFVVLATEDDGAFVTTNMHSISGGCNVRGLRYYTMIRTQW